MQEGETLPEEERLRVPACVIGHVPIHAVTVPRLLGWVERRIQMRQPGSVFYANAYAVNLAEQHLAFRQALQGADLVFCDGYGVRLAASLLGTPLPARMTPPDWMIELVQLCARRGWRLFLLGAEDGVVQGAAAQLRMGVPTLQVACHHGYFEPHGPANAELLAHLHAAAPDVLLVGMGMPRQELWVQANLMGQPAPVVITVGALFDYLGGKRRRGPRWLTDGGGEWLWRLLNEPRRLWQRYILGNPIFLWRVMCQWLRQRRGQAG